MEELCQRVLADQCEAPKAERLADIPRSRDADRWIEVPGLKILAEHPTIFFGDGGKRARTVPIYGDMETWLKSQFARRAPDCPWVLYYHRRPVGAQLAGWREACERAGLPGLLFHDLRRSAVRNMKRAGNPDKAVMEISGHKTRSIFDRYDIVSDADIASVAERTEEYLKARKEPANKLRRVK
jgi:integrase